MCPASLQVFPSRLKPYTTAADVDNDNDDEPILFYPSKVVVIHISKVVVIRQNKQHHHGILCVENMLFSAGNTAQGLWGKSVCRTCKYIESELPRVKSSVWPQVGCPLYSQSGVFEIANFICIAIDITFYRAHFNDT